MSTVLPAWTTEFTHNVRSLRTSAQARHGLRNAVYSTLDYIAQPIGMLMAAPLLVHRLGLSQYGVWMLVSTVTASMALIGNGFGDATVKFVSKYRAYNDAVYMRRVIGNSLLVNALLASMLAVPIWFLGSILVVHVFNIDAGLQEAAIKAFKISSILLIVRSLEIVFVCTLRALEMYSATVKISILSRAATIIAAVIMASCGFGVVSIMVSTLLVALVGMGLQVFAVTSRVGWSILPDLTHISDVVSFGCFSWMQAVAALLFIHADRLIIAALLGSADLACYTICVQAAQPIHGALSAAFNFVFPRISSKHEAGDKASVARTVKAGALINIAGVAVISIPLICFATPLLKLWMGAAFAARTHWLFSLLVIGYGLLAINVVPHYALLGMGEVRFVTMSNILGGVLSLVAMVVLIPWWGLLGAGISRILYGPAVSLNFIRLVKIVPRQAKEMRVTA